MYAIDNHSSHATRTDLCGDARVLALTRRLGAADDEATPAVTLLDLVGAASDVFESESEALACAARILGSGRARLGGNFRGAPIDLVIGSAPGREAANR